MEERNPLIAEVKYFPYPMPKRWSCENFCYDEVKMNMLWLVMPEVDSLVDQAWGGNHITTSIDAHLSKDLRELLCGPPVEFVRDFVAKGPLLIAEEWPFDYVQTMWRRAKQANARLCADLAPNVFKVDFKTRRRFG
jgi:hypothetical protein